MIADVLPDDAPKEFFQLLKRWEQVSKTHPPTRSDIEIEKLIESNGGLLLIESVPGKSMQEDLKFVKLGRVINKWAPVFAEGNLFSDAMHPSTLGVVYDSYEKVMTTGQPHYWEMTSVVYGVKDAITYQRLLLPLYKEDGTFDCFLADVVLVK